MINVHALAQHHGLGSLLDALRSMAPTYDVVDHWTQGEFHHDLVIKANDDVLVIATNCNGGVKEVVAFGDVPDRFSLWHWRCTDNVDFAARASSPLPAIRDLARTLHYFDPCELLVDNARSELKPSCRTRAIGGGWHRA
jgi:hypothetical protein